GWLSVAAVVWIWTMCAALPLVMLLPVTRVRLADRDLTLARQQVAHGLRYHLGFAAMFLLLRLDVLILNGLGSATQVGLYSVAVTVAELSKIVTDSTAQVALSKQAG